MLYNVNPFFKDLKEDVCLQHISILLNTINKTFKLLEQEVSVYCQDVKNHSFLFYGSRDDFESRAQIIPVIQKELEVYHYYKEVTFGLLYKILLKTFTRSVFVKTSISLNNVNF